MKKTVIQFRKVGGKLIPDHKEEYFLMLDTIKEEEAVRVEYSTVKSSKTKSQMGYLFGAVYPFIVYNLRETQGDVLYYRNFQGNKFPVLCNVQTVDTLFKEMYAESVQEEVKKSRMSIEDMSKYIDWLNKYCVDSFGVGIPLTTYGG